MNRDGTLNGITEVSLADFGHDRRRFGRARAMIDATVPPAAPGVLGNADSVVEEKPFSGLLEHPQYTRPADWKDRPIPRSVMSGNHGEIAKWRQAQSETPDRTNDAPECGQKNNSLQEVTLTEGRHDRPDPHP